MLDVEIGNGGRTQTGTKQQGGTDVTGQLRIIVLDTSLTTRKILEVILHREGHKVACFDEPFEALRALSREGPADLLLLALDLPKMDGFEVLKYLRGEPRFQSVATIALLGERDGVLVRLKARLAGAWRVVTKPLVRLFTLYVCVYDDTYPTRFASRLFAAVLSLELAPGSCAS